MSLDNKTIISNDGVSDGMSRLVVMRKLIKAGTGESVNVYGPAIILDQTVANITHTPTTSDASLAVNGGVIRSSKTGIGTITMSVTSLSQDVLEEVMMGITKDPLTGALNYDFSNMSGNKLQLNYGETFSSGITKCYKFMNIKPSLPGTTVNASDPENTTLAANGSITFTPDPGTQSTRDMYTRVFNTDDLAGIENFMTSPYPPAIEKTEFNVSSLAPTSGSTLATTGKITVTFNNEVDESLLSYVSLMSSTGNEPYIDVKSSELKIENDATNKKVITVSSNTGFKAADKLMLIIDGDARDAKSNLLGTNVVATYTVSG